MKNPLSQFPNDVIGILCAYIEFVDLPTFVEISGRIENITHERYPPSIVFLKKEKSKEQYDGIIKHAKFIIDKQIGAHGNANFGPLSSMTISRYGDMWECFPSYSVEKIRIPKLKYEIDIPYARSMTDSEIKDYKMRRMFFFTTMTTKEHNIRNSVNNAARIKKENEEEKEKMKLLKIKKNFKLKACSDKVKIYKRKHNKRFNHMTKKNTKRINRLNRKPTRRCECRVKE